MELLDGGKSELTDRSNDDDDGITVRACNPAGELQSLVLSLKL